MVKRCRYCGRYFVPDKRAHAQQKACQQLQCRGKRKKEAQRLWCSKNPGYFRGDYWRVKSWRQKKAATNPPSVTKCGPQEKKQVMIPLPESYQWLILLIPKDKSEMIQDEILLRRVSRYIFAAYGE